jgi:predicted outer membrane repeat protein
MIRETVVALVVLLFAALGCGGGGASGEANPDAGPVDSDADIVPDFGAAGDCTVVNSDDSGNGSLRGLLATTSCSRILFPSNMAIHLTSPLQVDRTVTIEAALRKVVLDGAGVPVMVVGSRGFAKLTGLTITNSGSTSGNGGGLVNGGRLTVTACSLSNNRAVSGGAIYSTGSQLAVFNSTFSGNTATQEGSAIYSTGTGSTSIYFSTFTGNGATSTSATLHSAGSGVFQVVSSIVVKGTAGAACAGAITGSSSLANDASCGSAFANSGSILLAAPADNGGVTLTCALLPGSTAIDAAQCNTTLVPLDQRGETRTRQGAACDVGAFESRGFSLARGTGNSQAATINRAFAAPLTVRLLEGAVVPLAGAIITFTAPASGASTKPATVTSTTGADGWAAAVVAANATIGTYSVTASAVGVNPVPFTLSNAQRVFTLTGVSGDGQSATVSKPFAMPLKVNLKEGTTPIAGAVVTFTAPASGASTNPATLTSTTDSNGDAAVAVTANAVFGGPYAVTTTADLATPVVFSLTNACGISAVVTSAADTGPGSLRAALDDPDRCASSTISFGASMVITLATPLTVTKAVTIMGSESVAAEIGGGSASRVFSVNAGATLNLSMLTVKDGNCGAGCKGGGIYNEGTVNVTQCMLLRNKASLGGAIYNKGTVSLISTTLSGNTAEKGGVTFSEAGSTLLSFVTAAENSASVRGALLSATGGAFTMTRSIAWNNGSTGSNLLDNSSGGTVTVSDSIVEGGYAGVRNSDKDPLLSALYHPFFFAASYIPSPTLAYDTLPGSPAMWYLRRYEGATIFAPTYPGDVFDQRGVQHLEALCDIGAMNRNYSFMLGDSSIRPGSFTSNLTQSTTTGAAFPLPIAFAVSMSWPHEDSVITVPYPVVGGKVYFEVPISGPSAIISPNPATVERHTDRVGKVTVTATANDFVGSYDVCARTNFYNLPGTLDCLAIHLTNQCQSQLTVTNANDSGVGSLRWAVQNVCEGGRVTFDKDYRIVLSSTLAFLRSITVDGEGHAITVDGNKAVAVVKLQAGSTLMNLTISGGNSDVGGGLVATGATRLVNVTFLGNHARRGGAIDIYQGTVAMTNVVFSGNSADEMGGAIYADWMNYDPSILGLEMNNVTFSGNTAGTSGSVLYNAESDQRGLIKINNCIAWGNTAPASSVFHEFPYMANTTTIAYSDLEGSFPSGAWNTAWGVNGGGNRAVDPLFVNALGADGIAGTADDDLRLRATSPAMDAGSNMLVPADAQDVDRNGNTSEPMPVDRARKARFVDGPVANTGAGTAPIVDMGAYEYSP